MAEHVPGTLPPEGNVLTDSAAAGEMPVEIVGMVVTTSSVVPLEQSLRKFARWLVAAAQKGAPGQADRPPAVPQKSVDVAPEPKVVSKPG